ncbi:hypothetical protein EKH77_23005 [Streptomyces luteoverticillatus]|uniref:Uncharacterized protein n=1 Tax=Streptomyces luteoverticillatus TaxID=66425 RepID=A0A3Q9G171_STRLT|nr:hypothetical protein [Streptomyces luteoverticillatus]AZQ73709.1 hypothetical protein EKH77_23005 [Streptomyces luteoverticillatus]
MSRTAAISGFVIIALTGASGCGSDSSGKSSGSAAAAAATTDGSGDGTKDVSISDCAYVEKQGIAAKLSAMNPSATATYSYTVTVKFTAPDGSALDPQDFSLLFVRPGRTDSHDITAPYNPKAGAPTKGAKCEIAKVVRGTG